MHEFEGKVLYAFKVLNVTQVISYAKVQYHFLSQGVLLVKDKKSHPYKTHFCVLA